MDPHSTIAHFKIVAKLGEGGMGAVYRATDTKLNRDVAIKVLPESFAADAARMQRFEREAQVLASLNHPNIAGIYGVEEGAIVMELVEGTDLRGPVPIDTAIAYARQIVAGLEAAHEKGIVHRDLKPANIKVTPDGVVKLLDFGLAKAGDETSSTAGTNPAMSPTLSMAMTQAGMILGTAAYMSPEQARGRPVDKRADIWAFGVVLFEMLAGRQTFGDGETVTDIIAAVVKEDPDWKTLPSDTPPRIRRLLERCLHKDPKLRLRDIGEARILLDEAEPEPLAAPPASGARPRAWLPWAIAALALLGAVTVAGIAWLRPKPAEPITARFPFPLPEGTTEHNARAATLVVPSPDGRHIAFIAVSSNGKSSLWVRPLGSPSAHRMDKTEGAMYPFWSPDSQFIAFFMEDSLKKIPVAGGSPQQVCQVPRSGTGTGTSGDGGTWNRDGVIVFGSGLGKLLMRVLAAGGPATPVTTLDQSAGDRWHSWPQFLPDGKHLLYFAEAQDSEHSAIYVQELGSAKRVRVMNNGLHAVWSPPGYLLYPRDGTLLAQAMDPKTFQLTGEPVAVAEDVSSNEDYGRAAFAVSGNGMLVYRGGVLFRSTRLAWYGRDGKRLGVVGQLGEYTSVRLSPDDKSAVLGVGARSSSQLAIMDLATGVLARATGNSDISTILGPWSPDLSRIAVNRRNAGGILELMVASGKTRDLLPAGLYANDWSPDGRLLLCTDLSGNRLAVFPADGGAQPQTISETPYHKTNFRFAPDGRSVAYVSLESGRDQISIASFPSFAEKRQVSIDGGRYPAWRKDGRELFFSMRDGTVMSAEIKSGPKIESGIPKPLFKLPTTERNSLYAPAGDGKRFLVLEGEQQAAPSQIMVVLNWTAELKQP